MNSAQLLSRPAVQAGGASVGAKMLQLRDEPNENSDWYPKELFLKYQLFYYENHLGEIQRENVFNINFADRRYLLFSPWP